MFTINLLPKVPIKHVVPIMGLEVSGWGGEQCLKIISSFCIFLMFVPGAQPGLLWPRDMSARDDECVSRPINIPVTSDTLFPKIVLPELPFVSQLQFQTIEDMPSLISEQLFKNNVCPWIQSLCFFICYQWILYNVHSLLP